MCFGGEFIIRPFDNGIDWTRLGTETAIDTFRHINIVPYCSSSTILTFLCFNWNGLCRARCLTQLAGDTAFLTRWITTQSVFPTKSRTQISTFEWVVNSHLWFRKCFTRQCKGTENFRQEEDFGGILKYFRPRCLWFFYRGLHDVVSLCQTYRVKNGKDLIEWSDTTRRKEKMNILLLDSFRGKKSNEILWERTERP